MANTKISELNELTTPLSGDTLPIVNSSETKKITLSNLLSGSNCFVVQDQFWSTRIEDGENFKVGNSAWIGDINSLDTIQVKGTYDTGSAFIKFGDATMYNTPRIGHDSNEQANVFYVDADTTKLKNALILGSGSLLAGNPEMIHVYSSGSYNIAYFVGNSDIYSQINIKNIATGQTSTTDLVLTADNGNENELYINLGINSSNYNEAFNIGSQNDGYLIMNGQDLFIGSINGGPTHGHVHIFASSSFQDPQISVLTDKTVGFNTSGVTSGFTYEFSGSAKFNDDLRVDGHIQSDANIYLQPDINDVRNIQIYNTQTTDIHIKGNSTYTFFGDDSNYLKIDSSLEQLTINSNSGTTVNGLVVLSEVANNLNFTDDAAAAAGGVPVGGLYRNGNFIMIRLT